jgi:O-acetylserine/cysteine efflux transporter
MTALPKSSLTPAHALQALAVVAVWGANFTVVKVALTHLPPLFMASLRFALAVVPAIFFVPRPAVSWSKLVLYGVAIGAGQFGLLFLALNGHISPGLASLVVQVQIFFTIGMAIVLRGERVKPMQWLALVLATLGLVVIVANTGADATILGILMVVAAGFCWAIGNAVTGTLGGVNILAFIVWSSLFAVPPLFALALLFEGWPAMELGLVNADLLTWSAVLFQTIGNTLFGYGAWAWLLSRYPAATVSPLALLIPVFGIGTSALVLGEPVQPWKLAGGALVISGLALNMLATRR